MIDSDCTNKDLELFDITDIDYRFKNSEGKELIVPIGQVKKIIYEKLIDYFISLINIKYWFEFSQMEQATLVHRRSEGLMQPVRDKYARNVMWNNFFEQNLLW